MANVLCPYCFHKFSTKEAQYQCINEEKKYVKPDSSRASEPKPADDDLDFSSLEADLDAGSQARQEEESGCGRVQRQLPWMQRMLCGAYRCPYNV